MDRRKFLIGAGSLAAGSAAALGTGAFTSVEADRGVQVSVADDASAFLQIKKDTEDGDTTPNAEEYVDVSDGTISLDFTSTDAPGNGEGINDNATTEMDNLLKITNQGTQEVIVAYRGLTKDGDDLTNQGFALYHEESDLEKIGDPTNDGLLNYQRGSANLDNLPRLEPGETLKHVGAFFWGTPNVTEINESKITFLAGDEPEDL